MSQNPDASAPVATAHTLARPAMLQHLMLQSKKSLFGLFAVSIAGAASAPFISGPKPAAAVVPRAGSEPVPTQMRTALRDAFPEEPPLASDQFLGISAVPSFLELAEAPPMPAPIAKRSGARPSYAAQRAAALVPDAQSYVAKAAASSKAAGIVVLGSDPLPETAALGTKRMESLAGESSRPQSAAAQFLALQVMQQPLPDDFLGLARADSAAYGNRSAPGAREVAPIASKARAESGISTMETPKRQQAAAPDMTAEPVAAMEQLAAPSGLEQERVVIVSANPNPGASDAQALSIRLGTGVDMAAPGTSAPAPADAGYSGPVTTDVDEIVVVVAHGMASPSVSRAFDLVAVDDGSSQDDLRIVSTASLPGFADSFHAVEGTGDAGLDYAGFHGADDASSDFSISKTAELPVWAAMDPETNRLVPQSASGW
ncbi:hypothetical protein [Lacisediminimonas profundi]|uniref:hypothetical protein n=1 Tax=Lacisediminimonas profundi TaxID=2603856 RepID=UPI00124B9B68|nr:hypothetical protein [Lacisediminimonas profundi]